MLAPAIPNDAERRVAGQRIGSGGIEKGVDVALLNDAWDRLIPPDLTAQQLPAFRRFRVAKPRRGEMMAGHDHRIS